MEEFIRGSFVAGYFVLSFVFIRLGLILDELRDINKKMERDDEKPM